MTAATRTGAGRRRPGLETWLALAAIALGALALAGDPTHGGGRVSLDTRELAAIVEGEVDHVTALELADWILRGRTDFRLLDLRDAAEYAEYRIPLAENVPLTGLPDYPLLRNEKIVLYSGGGIHSAQAWFLLRAEGYRGVYMLLGGLDAWKDEVLFPALPQEPTPAQHAEVARRQALATHFGGTPRSGAEAPAELEPAALPTVAAPAAPPPSARRPKRKEGC